MTDLPAPALLAAAGLHLDVAGPLATVVLDKADRRNSQTPRMWTALADIGDALPPEVRVVVVRGAGQSFSSGLDRDLLSGVGLRGEQSIPALMAESDDTILDTVAGFQRGFAWLRDPRFVSVAAVQGHAIGGGFQLALHCDLRVVAEDAQLCMKEPALGIVPDLGGTKLLVDSVGYSRAMEICATGRFVGAAEARGMGLATVVVPRDELDGAVDDLVAALLATPAGAVRETKALLLGAGDRSLDEQRRFEREAQLRRFVELRGS
ncbi:enoyl-CoA hydratase/isomerase family protein [Nocardioides terrisoli]|uniref:enoyl-CoA hydratase/isomerase family protein n=1 Tax=Nocardioides terrisoli TaxID=3388267 RepID=UPI00287B6DF6|nr:enoyl-CoA hydratase/isomerase family protein [Nocardioides marmorisolisilvae]